jgi:hypothetical protein
MWPTVKKSIGRGLIAAEKVGRKVLGVAGVVIAATAMGSGCANASELGTSSVMSQFEMAPVLLVLAGQDESKDWFRGHRSHSSHRSHRSHQSHYSSR